MKYEKALKIWAEFKLEEHGFSAENRDFRYVDRVLVDMNMLSLSSVTFDGVDVTIEIITDNGVRVCVTPQFDEVLGELVAIANDYELRVNLWKETLRHKFEAIT